MISEVFLHAAIAPKLERVAIGNDGLTDTFVPVFRSGAALMHSIGGCREGAALAVTLAICELGSFVFAVTVSYPRGEQLQIRPVAKGKQRSERKRAIDGLFHWGVGLSKLGRFDIYGTKLSSLLVGAKKLHTTICDFVYFRRWGAFQHLYKDRWILYPERHPRVLS